MAVELGSVSLELLTHVEVRETARIVLHEVPGLEGSLSQALGRSSVLVELRGIFYGPTASDDLGRLRAVYLDRTPVDFFADAVGDGYFAQVILSRLEVRQRARALDEFDYACELVEYVEPPEPAALGGLEALDGGILGEAAAFMDDVQGAIETVSDLVDTLTSFPNFGNPTEQLSTMPNEYNSLLSGEGVNALAALRDLF